MENKLTTYKIIIKDRNYNEWDIFDNNNNSLISDIYIKKILNPIENKFFSNDIIYLPDDKEEKNKSTQTLYSEIKSMNFMPCVLILDGNKTYGKHKNKLLYKCIPNNKQIPFFLVPYDLKITKFSKKFINLFVTIKYISWENKHPLGSITNNFGNVDNLNSFYEYQLYCKNINISISCFSKEITKKIEKKPDEFFINKIVSKYTNIENRTNQNEWFIFSVDPISSIDFDDAFSIKQCGENYILSIYISNVPIWLDILDVWNNISQRVNTIYLPQNAKKSMLPSVLSNSLCSLQSNVIRIAFVLDITIDKNYSIQKIEYCNSIVNVCKNYYYEEPDLLKNKNYRLLNDLVYNLNKQHGYGFQIQNSHKLVEYLMIFVNYHTSLVMIKHGNGICKTFLDNVNDIKLQNRSDTYNFIKIFNKKSSYMNIKNAENNQQFKHELLGLSSYIHITSPIRRIVDLLNILQIQKNLNLIAFSNCSNNFYDHWIKQIDFINSSMKTIKNYQNNCFLLDLCFNNPDTCNKVYQGYSFDKNNMAKYNDRFKYKVYLPELNFFSSVITEENINDYELRNYTLFIFKDSDNFKKKIRLQLL